MRHWSCWLWCPRQTPPLRCSSRLEQEHARGGPLSQGPRWRPGPLERAAPRVASAQCGDFEVSWEAPASPSAVGEYALFARAAPLGGGGGALRPLVSGVSATSRQVLGLAAKDAAGGGCSITILNARACEAVALQVRAICTHLERTLGGCLELLVCDFVRQQPQQRSCAQQSASCAQQVARLGRRVAHLHQRDAVP